MAKKPVKITEVVLRDAHQSLLATRMTMDEMRPILPEMDKIPYFSVECWGGATFDSCIRFLDEDPWERLRILRKELPHQKLQMLFRGQNMLGYRPYADDAVEYFVQKSVANGIDVIRYPGQDGIITGSSYGGLYFLKRKADGTCEPKRHIVDETFNALRHPTIWPTPVVYPNEQGEYVDLLATGEGGAFYYRFTGKFASDGRPVYDDPVTLKEKNPALYAGSLVTPTLVDWDGDGKLDIVCGNSAGHILFFRNAGTNRNPSFRSGTYLKAGNEIIHIQPGYGEDIQGPGESRWGYVGANVFDWNNDGKPDILTNDSRGKHTVFMQGANGLKAGKSIYLNDLELHGMWRCRPGVGTMAGKYVYFTLDDQDEIHRYFREDDYNLTDGGKMKLTDGSSVKANWLEAGGKGRLRFEIVDWDGDGIKDLLLATNMHHMIPDTIRGIPWSRPKPLRGATLLFLRNAGIEADPVFEFPKQLKYKGELVRFGHHGCGASTGMIGKITDGLPNVVVGDERGSIYLLEREHLSW